MKTVHVIFALLIGTLIACFPPAPGQAQTPKPGGTLIIGTEKDPQGIDPHKALATEGISILPQIFDGLLNIDDEGNVVPGMAEAMPAQPDPVTYLFTIRKGVKTHQKADFDAQDVKFSFDRLMNKEISHYWKTYQAMIKSVEVLDPYKVKITLNAPNAAFLDVIAKFPETRLIPRGAGPKAAQPVGTGGFKFKEWIKDDRLTLVRNEQYWKKGLPYLDQVIYKPFPEPSTRVINLRTGKVDLVHALPIQDAVELKKDPRIKILGRSGGQTEQFWFNTTKPPFDNKKVRQAIAYAIDRKSVADSVFMGFAEVAQNLFPSWYWAYNANFKFYPYDPEKAKALLKEAGYSAEKPLSFTMSCTNEPIFVDQGTIIQSQLAKIGVKMAVQPVEKSYWYSAWIGKRGDFEATMEDFMDDMTDLQWIFRFFSAKSYYSYSGYNGERYGKKGAQNPEVERLIDEVLKVNDRNQAKKKWDEIQQKILDDMPILYLSFYQNIIGMRDYVKNHKILTRNTVLLERVWVEK